MEDKGCSPAADPALYKLYQVKTQQPKPEETKPHPYQSFDINAFFKSVKKPDPETENQKESSELVPKVSPTQATFVSDLEGRVQEPEKPADGLENLMNKLVLSGMTVQQSSDIPANRAVSQSSVASDASEKILGVHLTDKDNKPSVQVLASQTVKPRHLAKLKGPEGSKESGVLSCSAEDSVRNIKQSGNETSASVQVVHSYSEKSCVSAVGEGPEPQLGWKITDFRSESIVSAKRKRTRRECARCILCHCDIDFDEVKIKAHITSEEHLKEKLRAGRTITLALLPQMKKTGPHTEKLNELVNDIELMYSIPPDQLKQNQLLLKKYEELIASKDSEKTLLLTGSMLHGIALDTSDINFALKVQPNRSAFQEIHHVKTILSEAAFVEKLRMEPTGILHFVDKPTSKKITVSVYSDCHHGTALVLKEYADYMLKHNREAWKIVGCFRAWAHVCGLDRKDDGMMHGYMFVVMAICILQSLRSVPVLAEMRSKEQLANWKPKAFSSMGELWWLFWLELVDFKFKVDAFTVNSFYFPRRDQRGWGVKRLAIESPGDPAVNLCRDVPCLTAYDQLIDIIKTSAYYFCVPQLHTGPLFHVLEPSVGPQPRQRLRKLSDDKNDIVPRKRKNSTEKTSVSEGGRKNSTRRESASSEDARQRLDSVASGEGLVPLEDEEDEIEIEFQEEVEVEYRDDSDLKKIKYLHIETETCDRILVQSDDESSEDDDEEDESSEDECLDGVNISGGGIVKMSIEHANKELEKLKAADLHYKFHHSVLMDDKGLLKLCMTCKSSGHNSASCPELRLPPVKPLPPLTHDYYYRLEEALYAECKRLKPTDDELRRKKDAIEAIQVTVRQRFSKAIIQPFGSCNNGFGCAHSDLDLCLMFENNPTGEDVDGVKIVNQLAAHLRRNKNFNQVIAISNAKVPIVKAYYLPYEIEVDISVYNTLGIHNTRLLYTYATMDERVQNLGYLAKSMAKLCDIGDASKGSLSSYAYILMVLYYAQRCQPPLIPNLQEFYVGDSMQTPQRIIDGWNTWFLEPNPNVPMEALWPHYKKNTSPLSVHWLNFLSFYAESFDWSNFVIAIRQSLALPKMDKNWADRELCIEDPFNLSHNLSGGLTLKMATYIKTAFIECREHFGFPISELPAKCSSWQEYFWSPKFLVKSKPPNDRPGCFICGCIRHKRNDCPKRLQLNRKNNRQHQGGAGGQFGRYRPRPERPEGHNTTHKNGNAQFRQRDLDDAGVKYQPKVRTHHSESDASQENSGKPRHWEKYLPKNRGAKNQNGNRRNGANGEDWPTLPMPSSPGRLGSEPLRDSNVPNRGASKKLDLDQLQARVFAAKEKKNHRTNKKKRNLSTGDTGDL